MKRSLSWCTIATLVTLLSPSIVAAGDDVALTQLVRILRDQGVLDDGQFAELSARAAEREQHWWDRIHLSGDLRARYERFEFDGDRRDRGRGRYRARLGIAARLNPRAEVVLRLASGELDSRSTNESFGGNDDFAKDALEIDRAYAAISAFEGGELPSLDGSWWAQVGRVPNPFRSKAYGKDFLLWDGDVNLEGVQSLIAFAPARGVEVYGNSGFYVLDEESSGRDPQLFAGQIGGSVRLSDDLELGARSSIYAFGRLDSAFVMRGVLNDAPGSGATDGRGNLLGGLTGSANGGDVDVLEFGAYLASDHFEGWPLRVYGEYSNNLSAESVFGAGRQDEAWGVGVAVGDKTHRIELGAGYWHLEANAFPSMFVDSDLFDGSTNREGWVAYVVRRILPGVDLSFSAFVSDPIETGFPFDDETLGGESTRGADRVRLQADVVYAFK